MSILKKGLSLIIVVLSIIFVQAETVDPVTQLQQQWAKANYQLQEGEQLRVLEQLIVEADLLIAQKPNDAFLLLWSGIIKSSYAGAKGGPKALKFAKQSKKELEKVITIEPTIMNGAAYTSLGALYFKTPAWPVGFGRSKKAKHYLLKGLDINPNGIDSNFFYAQYLHKSDKLDVAIIYYKKALLAPKRPGRKVEDEGRRSEIEQVLALIKNTVYLSETK